MVIRILLRPRMGYVGIRILIRKRMGYAIIRILIIAREWGMWELGF